METLITSNRFY